MQSLFKFVLTLHLLVFHWPKQITSHPRWRGRERLHIFMGSIPKSYCKGMDTKSARICSQFGQQNMNKGNPSTGLESTCTLGFTLLLCLELWRHCTTSPGWPTGEWDESMKGPHLTAFQPPDMWVRRCGPSSFQLIQQLTTDIQESWAEISWASLESHNELIEFWAKWNIYCFKPLWLGVVWYIAKLTNTGGLDQDTRPNHGIIHDPM
jgi:hypothetical protein